MRRLALALFIAWLTVGIGLLVLPTTLLEMELTAAKDVLKSSKNSPLADIPEYQKHVDDAKQLVADPTIRRIGLWVTWNTLLFLVLFGLWTAYATFRRRSYAMALVLIGGLLFLTRQAIFHRTYYELLLNGMNPIPWLLKNQHYQLAFSIVWYNYVLPLFFFLVTIAGCIHLGRKWLRSSQSI